MKLYTIYLLEVDSISTLGIFSSLENARDYLKKRLGDWTQNTVNKSYRAIPVANSSGLSYRYDGADYYSIEESTLDHPELGETRV